MKKQSCKVVYILISGEDDFFTEMAILSITALNIVSPVNVEIVTDVETLKNLRGHRKKILDLADIITEFDADSKLPVVRSRFAKTRLRHLVDGDFLYLDVDAVPVGELYGIFGTDCDIAVSHDMGVRNIRSNPFYQDIKNLYGKIGWNMIGSVYYNAGVIFARDNERVRGMFNLWHDKWVYSVEAGVYQDQPSFNHAVIKSDVSVTPLKPQWNALIGLSTKGVKKAKVMHYTTVNFDTRNDTLFHYLVKNIKKTGCVDDDSLIDLITSGYPWTNQYSIKLKCATGNYFAAAKIACAKAFRKFT